MGWIEYLLIVAGSSLEIFVAMECQGSLIQKVNKKQLTAICFIVAVCQLLAMYIGYFLSSFLNGKYSVKDEALLGEIISIGILIDQHRGIPGADDDGDHLHALYLYVLFPEHQADHHCHHAGRMSGGAGHFTGKAHAQEIHQKAIVHLSLCPVGHLCRRGCLCADP